MIWLYILSKRFYLKCKGLSNARSLLTKKEYRFAIQFVKLPSCTMMMNYRDRWWYEHFRDVLIGRLCLVLCFQGVVVYKILEGFGGLLQGVWLFSCFFINGKNLVQWFHAFLFVFDVIFSPKYGSNHHWCFLAQIYPKGLFVSNVFWKKITLFK